MNASPTEKDPNILTGIASRAAQSEADDWDSNAIFGPVSKLWQFPFPSLFNPSCW